jgi:xanthine dehydrogenase YagR molybdenum-binding subunit
MSQQIGKPVNRVDGPLKVCGNAVYAGDVSRTELLEGVIVNSTITKGKIQEIDETQARAVPGVIEIFTHKNRPSLAWFDKKYKDEDSPDGSPFRPLYDSTIAYAGQPVALVVAETFEAARFASGLLKIKYKVEEHQVDLEHHQNEARDPKKMKGGSPPPPKPKGDAQKAFQEAQVKIETHYTSPTEHHSPMEPHATTVEWSDEGFLIHDKTQGVLNSQKYVCNVFGLNPKEVRVVSPFVGGAFGACLRPQYQLFLAVMAAKVLKKSVRVVMTRQQMFNFGHRPHTIQRLALGANKDGKLTSLIHRAVAQTSQFEDYTESVVNWSSLLYSTDSHLLEYKLVPLDLHTPLDMRAPGATIGLYGLEGAMDELAYKLDLDPLKLRIMNYTEKDENEGKPFSSKALLSCFEEGAKKFGWEKRNPKPRSTKRGHQLVGSGMASGAWDAFQQKAKARIILETNGKAEICSATSDIGTGTYTIMTQIAAETLGLPLENIQFKLGDSDLPPAPLQGGSWTAATVGSAVQDLCLAVKDKLFKNLQKQDERFKDVEIDEVKFENGRILLLKDPAVSVSLTSTIHERMEEETTKLPPLLINALYSRKTHSAVFAEVEVDEDLGTVKVTRIVSAIAAGRILNPKTARSQILGGVVWGISMALQEESKLDAIQGKFMNHSFAEYHIPVNADIQDIDVIFVDEPDEHINKLGIKGVGEIGLVGVAAAISNAIYHATGKRVHSLPMTMDKIRDAQGPP